MKISEAEEAELIEWGIRFYQLGWDNALDTMAKVGKQVFPHKEAAIRRFIMQLPDMKESTDK